MPRRYVSGSVPLSNTSTTIDFEVYSCDELCLITGKVGARICNIFWGATSAQWDCRDKSLSVLLGVRLAYEKVCPIVENT